MHELREFATFLREYGKARILKFGHGFEQFKDVVVAFLIVKRGKYSTSFLNTSFFLLVAAAIIGGPIIAENNPLISSLEQTGSYQSAVVAYNPAESSLTTIISAKPRDKIIEYSVAGGDTLESIGRKFDVSVESIKWANNNMKTDTIKPGQKLNIPPITGVVHKVASGDNIYSIAKKYKTDAQKIVNFPFNEFADLDTFALTPGQNLYVPDGVIEEEQPRFTQPYFAQIQAGVKGSSNFIWPTSGGITQYPVWYHMALDIANSSSPPVLASDTGTVIFAACIRYGYGCHVIIDHANGYQSLYGHLSSIAVSPGQAVSQGASLGNMGSTGRSTGTHLHFEIRSGEGLLNPLNFLK
jgi:murein DD-endopeptidase MepM/ murein hydrolase activator NlpD